MLLVEDHESTLKIFGIDNRMETNFLFVAETLH
jgi:hypothetical protein